MPRIAIFFGIVLIMLGVLGYVQQGKSSTKPTDPTQANSTDTDADDQDQAKEEKAEKPSLTALIPSIFGAIIGIFGVFALNPDVRKHAMHGAVLTGTLGVLAGLIKAGMDIVNLITGMKEVNLVSLTFVCLMAILCGAFVYLCVQSFRQARRQRESESEAPQTSS